MADVLLDSSPLAPGRSPVRIHYRDAGRRAANRHPARRLGLRRLSVRPSNRRARVPPSDRDSRPHGLWPLRADRHAGDRLSPIRRRGDARGDRGPSSRSAHPLGTQRRRDRRAADWTPGARSDRRRRSSKRLTTSDTSRPHARSSRRSSRNRARRSSTSIHATWIRDRRRVGSRRRLLRRATAASCAFPCCSSTVAAIRGRSRASCEALSAALQTVPSRTLLLVGGRT